MAPGSRPHPGRRARPPRKSPTPVADRHIEVWLEREGGRFHHARGRAPAGTVTLTSACCAAFDITPRSFQRAMARILARRKRLEQDALRSDHLSTVVLAALARRYQAALPEIATGNRQANTTRRVQVSQPIVGSSLTVAVTSSSEFQGATPVHAVFPPRLTPDIIGEAVLEVVRTGADRPLLMSLLVAARVRLETLGPAPSGRGLEAIGLNPPDALRGDEPLKVKVRRHTAPRPADILAEALDAWLADRPAPDLQELGEALRRALG